MPVGQPCVHMHIPVFPVVMHRHRSVYVHHHLGKMCSLASFQQPVCLRSWLQHVLCPGGCRLACRDWRMWVLCKCTDAVCNGHQPQQLVCAVCLDDVSSWLVQACLGSQKVRRLSSACGGAAGRFTQSIFTRWPKWCTRSLSMIQSGVPVSSLGQVCR